MCAYYRYQKRTRRLTAAAELSQRFLQKLSARVGCPEQVHLVELWRNWPVVMGEYIASLGVPLGHRDRRLEVGTEDSMAMQELSYYRTEIIERANAFMEKPFFADVKFLLVANNKSLYSHNNVQEEKRYAPVVEKKATGKWLHLMDPNSAIARCYKAYCKEIPEK